MILMFVQPRHRLVLGMSLAAISLAGCAAATSTDQPKTLAISAAFYPLAYAAEQVGGPAVTVTTVTKPGAEPHDLELTPQDVAGLIHSSTIIYLKGFQPALDEAIDAHASEQGFDVTSAARATLPSPEHEHEGEDEDAGTEHQEEGTDPHFWLDPTRYAEVARAIGEHLAELDPAHAPDYRTRASDFAGQLSALDADFRDGLRTCASRVLVTSHAAFGYLADRYQLTQVSIAGVSPDAEPDAATMSEIVARIRQEGVTTVYSETLASPALAQTIARETGATMAVLDPIEGLTDQSAGTDYLEIMRSNLATLRAGQGCS